MSNLKINVINLFNGISTGYLSLQQLNIPVNKYFSSEVAKNPIAVSKYHFPDIIELDDIRNIDANELPKMDLLMCGSSCQDLSILNKVRAGLEGNKSSLFFDAVRILNVLKNKNPNLLFLFENVQMPKKDEHIISKLLGVQPIKINSNLVSGANRSRLYWTNIPNVELPTDRKITLQSIIENGYVDRKKANAVLTKNIPYTKNGLVRYLTKSLGQVVFYDKDFAYTSKDEKLEIIENMNDEEVRKLFRLFTVTELERLQTLPDGFVGNILKVTPSAKAIGNGYTNEVIKHILSFADFN